MTFILDDKAKFGGTHPSIEEYARACSDAIDEALKEWPIAETTENAKVSTGFVGDNELLSTLWTQSFEVAGTDDDSNDNEDSSLEMENLLSNLKDLFSSEDLGKHAKEWDATFAGASMLEKLSEKGDTILVHWKFNASPLVGRDMLYLIHRLTEEEETDGRILQLTYAYASVSDDWVKSKTGKDVDYNSDNDDTKRVRAFNCYPSCDRITVYKNDKTSGTKITVDHLMTTDLGGWIRPFCFNNFFKKALIQANVHECEAIREYVLSLCKSDKK